MKRFCCGCFIFLSVCLNIVQGVSNGYMYGKLQGINHFVDIDQGHVEQITAGHGKSDMPDMPKWHKGE